LHLEVIMHDLQPTELVLLVAKRRREARCRFDRIAPRPIEAGRLFAKRACLALLLSNALLYVVIFGLIGALGWGALAFVAGRAPID
jgi:hypothetical protein